MNADGRRWLTQDRFLSASICVHLRFLSPSLLIVLGALWVSAVCLPISGCASRQPRPGEARVAARPPGPPLFRDVAGVAGLHFKLGHGGRSPLDIRDTLGHGAGLLDVDGDGRLDVVLVGPDRCVLYRNEGSFRFADWTARSGLRQKGYWMGCAAADVDNDGRTDLLVTGHGGCALYRNEGGRFQEAGEARFGASGSERQRRGPVPGESAGVRDTGWSTSAGFADVDRDGWLDLYVARYVRFDPHGVRFCDQAGVKTACGPTTYDPQQGRLFHNEGNGRFRETTGLSGAHGNALGVAFRDYDRDGDVDLAVANDQLPSDLFRNDGGGRFENVGVTGGIAYNAAGEAYAGMGIDWGDVDRDGQPDLVVTTYQHQSRCLFRQDRPGLFTDVAAAAGLAHTTVNTLGFGARFFDYDNDGWLDLAMANGHVVDNIRQAEANVTYAQPAQLFRNRGAEGAVRFEEVSRAAGPDFTRPIVGRGLCVGDLDDDGRLDLLIVDAEGAPLLLRNETRSQNHWLSLRLLDRHGRDAIGARVRLTAGGRPLVCDCFTDGSYMSAGDPRVHLGLGDMARVPEIVVDWPDGRAATVLRDVAADRFLTIREGASARSAEPSSQKGPRRSGMLSRS